MATTQFTAGAIMLPSKTKNYRLAMKLKIVTDEWNGYNR